MQDTTTKTKKVQYYWSRRGRAKYSGRESAFRVAASRQKLLVYESGCFKLLLKFIYDNSNVLFIRRVMMPVAVLCII